MKCCLCNGTGEHESGTFSYDVLIITYEEWHQYKNDLDALWKVIDAKAELAAKGTKMRIKEFLESGAEFNKTKTPSR